MTTIQIEEDIKLKNTEFSTFADFINEVEDYKLGKIMKENDDNSFDIDLLEKKYLG